MERSDALIITEAQGGSLFAFEELVHRHERHVLNFVSRLVKHQEDAQDITQDVFIVYRKHRGNLDNRQKSLYDYEAEKGLHMKKTSGKTNYTPFAIVGIGVVLLLLIAYPKRNPILKETGNKVTIENEFSQDVPVPSGETPEEQAAARIFSLAVTSPKNQSTVTQSAIRVSGKTVAYAEVFVNETDARADTAGNFSVPYNLEEGENYIIVGANDEFGNYRETELTVYYEPQ